MGCESRSGSACSGVKASPEPGWGLDSGCNQALLSPPHRLTHMLTSGTLNNPSSVSLNPDPRQRHHSYPAQQAELRLERAEPPALGTGQWLSPSATELTCRQPRAPGHAASPPPAPAPVGACWPRYLRMWPGRSASASGAASPGDAESCSEPGQGRRPQRDAQHQGKTPLLRHDPPRPLSKACPLWSAPSPAASPS